MKRTGLAFLSIACQEKIGELPFQTVIISHNHIHNFSLKGKHVGLLYLLSDNICTRNRNRLELECYIYGFTYHISMLMKILVGPFIVPSIMPFSVTMVPLNYKTMGNC